MRTFHIEPLRLRLFYVVAGVVAIIGLALGAFSFWVVAGIGLDVIGLIVAMAPIVILGGIAIAIVIAAQSTRLELSETGITLHLPGSQMAAGWDDVESLAPVAWGPLSGDALTLRRPASVHRAWWFLLFADPHYASAIPLSPFALPLKGSRLEADLRLRLPHLFVRDQSAFPSVGSS